MLLEINPDNPSERKIKKVVEVLAQGGIIIYPSDTVYALGCDIYNQRAVEKICRLRQLNVAKARLTFICKDIRQIAEYTHQIENQTFKLLKRNLPGPFTFILKSGNKLPKVLKNKRRTIGVRVPDNQIATDIVGMLERPILSISLKNDDEILEYFTDPTEIHDDYKKLVDCVVDGGIGGNVPSTIVDCTDIDIDIIRQGTGALQY